MSLASWKEESYPVPACEVQEEDALAHALRKFLGLTKKALRKHGLKRLDKWILADDGAFQVDSDTCALCIFFGCGRSCPDCPLSIVRGGRRCDLKLAGERKPPYAAFIEDGDARPMISWLKRAIKAQERKP